MTICEKVDLSDIPVSALRPASKEKLCAMLNFNLVIPSPSGLPRDWRGLAQLLNVKPPCGYMPNPTGHILCQFEKLPNSTLDKLHKVFGELDRWDVFDDMDNIFQTDGKNYLQVVQNSPGNSSSLHIDFLTDDIVTLDDLHRAKNNQPPLIYDAFVLFAQEDEEFAQMTIDKLEKEYLAKVCYKDRDFIAGLPLEHTGVMKMLEERCHHLVVIISNSFIRSEFNKYFLNFAAAVGIEQRRVKIIPIVLEYCPDLPSVVRFCHLLDYTRSSKLYNFWDKLGQAVAQSRVSRTVLEHSTQRLMLEDIKPRSTNQEKKISQDESYSQEAKEKSLRKEEQLWNAENYFQQKASTCKSSQEPSPKSSDKKREKPGKIIKSITDAIRKLPKSKLSKKSKELACPSD
nr:PREDICTED: myeloid differentiation primary response protein MyD88-A [Bemisia tabaci]